MLRSCGALQRGQAGTPDPGLSVPDRVHWRGETVSVKVEGVSGTGTYTVRFYR
jgi:hypothetical protein